VPVVQEVRLWVHAPAAVQSSPATHEVQTPVPLQTWSVPQEVPAASGVAVSTQVDAPLAQEVVPTRQEVGFPSQASPAVQALHAPPLQTWSVPQVVPFGSGIAVLTHTRVPVAHEVTPVRHGSRSSVQATPATQARQVPPLQTWSVPQDVPFAIGVAVFSQVSTPVAQIVVPATQGFEL
jgi:hypothetical protein